MRRNKNFLELKNGAVGKERRLELVKDILSNGTFIPKTVVYGDIDASFKEWADKDLRIISDEGKVFPTMTLYSNQRFSEYSQSWKYTDSNNNLLLNFKTVTRENNPQYGKIQSGLWNIPGERFYTMKKMLALDDNGTESLLLLKMKQPVAIDMSFKLSIFTTKYSLLNTFNTLINKKFASRQCYIRPNGHYMPMILESIGDESEYNIDDRQFYSQTYNIKVMAYIITEDDYRVEERPYKRGIGFYSMNVSTKKTEVNLVEYDIEYFNGMDINIKFPPKKNSVDFTLDDNLLVTEVKQTNVVDGGCIITINEREKDISNIFEINSGDRICVKVKKKNKQEATSIIIRGFNPTILYLKDKNGNYINQNKKHELADYFNELITNEQ
jgi:hypothetical protein